MEFCFGVCVALFPWSHVAAVGIPHDYLVLHANATHTDVEVFYVASSICATPIKERSAHARYTARVGMGRNDGLRHAPRAIQSNRTLLGHVYWCNNKKIQCWNDQHLRAFIVRQSQSLTNTVLWWDDADDHRLSLDRSRSPLDETRENIAWDERDEMRDRKCELRAHVTCSSLSRRACPRTVCRWARRAALPFKNNAALNKLGLLWISGYQAYSEPMLWIAVDIKLIQNPCSE